MTAINHAAMEQHPLGIRQPVEHACPECGLIEVKPFCPVCLGTGMVDAQRLSRWQADQNRLIAANG